MGKAKEVDVFFRVCPKCLRSVPQAAQEQFCINDGTPLLERCPRCAERIRNPYTHFCAACGWDFVALVASDDPVATKKLEQKI